MIGELNADYVASVRAVLLHNTTLEKHRDHIPVGASALKLKSTDPLPDFGCGTRLAKPFSIAI